jgi:uncharacterized protein
MQEFNNTQSVREVAGSSILPTVYLWIAGALALSSMVGFYLAEINTSILEVFVGNNFGFLLFFGIQIGLVYGVSKAALNSSVSLAFLLFVVYSLTTGVTLGFVFLAFTLSSILQIGLLTAATFGAMSLIGFTTKKDLTTMGNILIMMLVGVIISSVVNFFLQSEAIAWIGSFISIFLFSGLIAYESQQLKQFNQFAQNNPEAGVRLSIVAALNLYISLIGLFINLLQIFGERR